MQFENDNKIGTYDRCFVYPYVTYKKFICATKRFYVRWGFVLFQNKVFVVFLIPVGTQEDATLGDLKNII